MSPNSFDLKNNSVSSGRSESGGGINGDTGSIILDGLDNLESTTSSSAPKDSFLNYFFGGAGKNERPALGSQEMMTKAQYAPPMSVNSMMESEMVKKLEQASINNEGGGPIVATDREELETQLIRKFGAYYTVTVKKKNC
jgi:dynamin 1-like protein